MSRAALAVVLVAAGCAGGAVRVQTATTDGLIASARETGAQYCAPVELAMAESHNDFAHHALDEGNYHEARSEAEIAETNARVAIDKSPRDKCADKAKLPPLPPQQRPPAEAQAKARPPSTLDSDGDGIPDDVDQCPLLPEDIDGFQDADGCPDDDNDGDGITDKLDRCPNEPEDRDGFQDADGCPDPDNDGDGIPDKVDQCPNQPEDKDGFEDADGCPDPDNDKDGIPDLADKCPNEPGPPPDGCPKKYNLVVVGENKLELKQTVFFDAGHASLKQVSLPLLDDVAQALKDHPTLKVEIQGHIDSSERRNVKLSQRRADSVRVYLVTKGVARDRMVARGYGADVPIADNRTAEGRAQNRRAEFVITTR